MRAPSLLIAVTLCVAPGCGPQAEVASSGAASTLPATTPSTTPLPVIDAVNALPTTMDAAAIWRGLAASVKVQAIAAMPRPIRWHIPACELRYALRTTMAMGSKDAPGGLTGVYLEGLLTARPRDGITEIWELVSALRTGFITDATRSPPTDLPPDAFASPRITSDGETWRELDDPTSLWSASSSWPGLFVFFPARPPTPQLGAPFDWKATIHMPAAAMAVEAAR